MLKTGDQAPHFALSDQDGRTVTLADYKGQWLLIYFYPKDNTPGCTKEAEAMRDHLAKFKKAGLHVVGVSTDSAASHKKFAEKFRLNFPLLADTEQSMVGAYGVWGEKKFMGKTYMGILRSSVLVGPEGNIVKVYEKVKPAEHAAEVLADLSAIMAASR